MENARRKMHNVHVRHPAAIDTEALNRISEAIRHRVGEQGNTEEEQLEALSRHSDTAKAFTHMLKRWDTMKEYCRNGGWR